MSRLRSAASTRSNATGASLRSGRTNRTQGTSVKLTKPSVKLEYPCGPCMRENNEIEATNYCKDCEDNLCANCVKDHSKFQTMQGHKILGKADRRSSERVEVTPPKVNPLECSQHPGKLVDMFCADHDEIWCGACMALNHKGCTNVMVIQTAAEGIAKQSVLKEIKDSSRKLKKDLAASKKQRIKDIARFDKHKALILKTLKEHRHAIDKILDVLEQETVSELERACEKGECEMKERLKLYENIITGLEAAAGLLTVAKGKEKDEIAMFVGLQRAKQNIKNGERLLSYADHVFTGPPIQYYPDDNIVNWLKGFTSLGTFSHQQKIYRGKLIDRYDVSMADDLKSCDMFGAAILSDGRLIVTDWDNKKVKHLDSSFKVSEHVTVPSNPNAVCLTTPDEAIVTLPMKNTIQFISLKPKMELTRMIVTEERCRGLCYNNGNIYVVAGGFKDETPGRVLVYSITGNLVRVIEKNQTGQQIFICPISISIRADGKLLYVTDGRRGVVTMTTDGNNVVSVVAHRHIAWPCGICLDNNGHILVCNGRTDSVLQCMGMYKFVTVISHDDGLRKPQSICFDSKTSRVVLTMNRSKFVYVYQLKDITLGEALKGATLNATAVQPITSTNHTAGENVDSKMNSTTTNTLEKGDNKTTNAEGTKVGSAADAGVDVVKNTTDETGPTNTLTSNTLVKITEEPKHEGKPEEKPEEKPSTTKRRLSSVPSDNGSSVTRKLRSDGRGISVRPGSIDQGRVKTSSQGSNVSDSRNSTRTNSAAGSRKVVSINARIQNNSNDRNSLKP